MTAGPEERRHAIRSFDDELDRLHATVGAMGRAALSQVDSAFSNPRAAETDAEVERLQAEVDRQTTLLIAKRQPVALDLRDVIGALNCGTSFGRVNAYAKSTARQLSNLVPKKVQSAVDELQQLATQCRALLARALNDYEQVDVEDATRMWTEQSDVERHSADLIGRLLTRMHEDRQIFDHCADLLLIARNLERIGEHARLIADQVVYRVHGTHLTDSLRRTDHHH